MSLWDEFRPLELSLDAKFDRFEKEMEETRKSMLADIRKDMSSDLVPSANTYSVSQSNVEMSTLTINGITFRFRTIEFFKERDGIRIPHTIRQIFCNPASPIDLLQENSKFKEIENDVENKVLTQFLCDQKHFGDKYEASKIWRYENEIDVDSFSGKKQYIIKVWYEAKDGQRFLYTFTYLRGDKTGTYRLDFMPGEGSGQSSEKKNL